MSNAFVDSTVICNAMPLPHVGPAKRAAAQNALQKYAVSETPFYALRELRAGPMGSLVAFHNLLVSRKSIPEAVEDFQKQSSFMPRKWAVVSAAFIASLVSLLGKLQASPPSAGLPDQKTQLENHLAMAILKAWRRRKSVVSKLTQPLGCWVDSEFTLAPDRHLRLATGGGDGCEKTARCAAAAALHSRSADVEILIAALKPAKGAAVKPELANRRKALKELLDSTPADFSKQRCRQLGDAYYCVMAPKGSELLTTNFVDFEPMTKALKQKLASL